MGWEAVGSGWQVKGVLVSRPQSADKGLEVQEAGVPAPVIPCVMKEPGCQLGSPVGGAIFALHTVGITDCSAGNQQKVGSTKQERMWPLSSVELRVGVHPQGGWQQGSQAAEG